MGTGGWRHARGDRPGDAAAEGDAKGPEGVESKRPRWETPLLLLEQAMWNGDALQVRRTAARFFEHFQHEPLLVTPLAQGGHPRLILRAGIALALLRALAANLPRLGLLREAYSLLRVVQTMEREQNLEGPRLTEFDSLFLDGLPGQRGSGRGIAQNRRAPGAGERNSTSLSR